MRVAAAFPANFGTEYDTHQGVVLYFDTERELGTWVEVGGLHFGKAVKG